MNNILVPVDFSEYSEYALEIACCIAKEKKVSIIVIHMMGLSEAVYAKNEAQEYEEAMYYMKLSKKRFKDFLNKPYTKGIKITEIVQNYKDFNELNYVAKEQKIDLIVMGSHGTKGFKEDFVGSNTEKVVRTSEVPVLVIKVPNHNFKINKIVFATDLKKESINALKKANNIAAFFSAELEILYVNTPGNQFLNTFEIQKRITRFKGKIKPNLNVAIYDDYNVEDGILNFSDNNNVDVIAIATHGRKGLSYFFSRSIGEDLANHAILPLMTFKI